MKKNIPLLMIIFFLGSLHLLKAQCYGYVKLDNAVNANGNSTFNIVTAHADELILIAYDGWSSPGNGPVTVDGNSATHLTTANSGNSGVSEVYYYSVTAVGTHTIVCTEPGYSSPYYMNFAAAFYDSATCTPLSGTNVTVAQNAFAGSGSNSVPITTTTPNELIFNTAEFNTGASSYGGGAATGAKDLDSIHIGTGLDAEIGYTKALTAGTYTVGTTDNYLNGGGGGSEILVALIPGTCSSAYTVSAAITQPSCLNNDGKIVVTTIGGTPPFTYTWSPNVGTTNTVSGLSAGTYIITVTSNDGICSTQKDTLHLVGATTVMTTKHTKCVPGNTGTATITITNGKPAFTYTWSNGQTTSTATGLSTGTYVVTVKDANGCIIHDTAYVTDFPPPTITAFPVSDSECYGSGRALTASGGLSYSWAPALGLSCTHCANPTATAPVSTVYTVTGADSNGCTNTATVTLKVIPLARVTVAGRDTICIGSSTTLTTSGGGTYLWSPGGNTTASYTARPPVTTTYTVKITLDGCTKDTTVTVKVVPVPRPVIHASRDSVCQGDTLTLEASGGTTYLWSPGNSTNAKIQVNLSNATTYTLYAYGGSCEATDSLKIKVIKLVTASVRAVPDTICPKAAVTITAAGVGGAVTYRWSNGATTSSITVNDSVTTSYTVTVHGTCDSVQLPVTVHVVPLPDLSLTGKHFECQGGLDTLSVTSSTNPTTYSWSTGQTGSSIAPTINGDKIYTVTATNSLGCSVSDTFSVREQAYPGAIMTTPTACGGGELIITATATGTGPFTYHWNTGGTYDTVHVNINKDTTIYTVTISNGCSITRTATVIEDNPEMYACCDTTILMGGSTGLVASGLGGTHLTNYQWSPPNSGLSCYNCPNPIAGPEVTTTYTVTGKDSSDCPIERTITVIVETPCYNFTVPNVFTPTYGGPTGENEVLYIQASNFSTWSLKIYDRWGHEVYKSTDDTKYWDGKNEGGTDSPEGVYYYVIDASCVSASFQKEGFVQLIR